MKVQQFDYSATLDTALLWHYNKARRLESLVLLKQLWYDINQKQFWENWYRDVFNLLTANDFGLSVWALILGVPIFITIPGHDGQPAWGFDEFHRNFNRGNFANASGTTTGLTTEEKRIVLRLRYVKLTSRCAIPYTNYMLDKIFTDFGKVYILDNLDMTITAIFEFYPSFRLRQAIKDYDLIPRGAGVGINYIIDEGNSFGFDEFHKNFNRGNFAPEF